MTKFSGPLDVIPGSNTSASNKLRLLKSGTDHTNPTINLQFTGTANSSATYIPTITNAAMGQATTFTIPDPGTSASSFLVTGSVSNQTISTGGLIVTQGNVQSGSSGDSGTFISYPATASKGSLVLAAVDNTGNTATTISNAAMGQASVVSIPDPGTATAKFLLDTGTGATATLTKLSTGATPVPLADAGSCTISAVAGAANVSTISVQLKDGAGTNIARSIPFKVYSSSAADGLTIASAASTGYSVASGGLKLPNENSSVTQGISCMSSATGAATLSLTDTGKTTSYLVLVVGQGTKISTQLSAGSYG